MTSKIDNQIYEPPKWFLLPANVINQAISMNKYNLDNNLDILSVGDIVSDI